MNKNLEIEIPEEIACMLNHQSQTYTSEFTITNHQNVHLYYYVPVNLCRSFLPSAITANRQPISIVYKLEPQLLSSSA